MNNSVMFVRVDSALGTMSVACGPASMLLSIESMRETTTAGLPNTTDIRDAHLPLVNITLSDKNDEESLQSDHFGKIIRITN